MTALTCYHTLELYEGTKALSNFIPALLILAAHAHVLRCAGPTRAAAMVDAMWQAIGWMCSLLAMSCALPSVAVIQSAYEREETAGSKLHDKDLQVLQAKCHDDNGRDYLCEVTFISKSDPTERLFFDIVAVAHGDGGGWVLKSGLCRR